VLNLTKTVSVTRRVCTDGNTGMVFACGFSRKYGIITYNSAGLEGLSAPQRVLVILPQLQ
jgi:hypothetical protein